MGEALRVEDGVGGVTGRGVGPQAVGGEGRAHGTAVCSFASTRDPNGNITKSLREDDSCWYYQYDGLQRLTRAEWKDSAGARLYACQYDYDKVGNRSHLLSDACPGSGRNSRLLVSARRWCLAQ